MCSNVKKSPQKNEIENVNNLDKNNNNQTPKEEKNVKIIENEEEFKDMEEWEGM